MARNTHHYAIPKEEDHQPARSSQARATACRLSGPTRCVMAPTRLPLDKYSHRPSPSSLPLVINQPFTTPTQSSKSSPRAPLLHTPHSTFNQPSPQNDWTYVAPPPQPLYFFIVLTLLQQAARVARVSARAVPSATGRSCVTTSRVSPSPPSVVLLAVVVSSVSLPVSTPDSLSSHLARADLRLQ